MIIRFVHDISVLLARKQVKVSARDHNAFSTALSLGFTFMIPGGLHTIHQVRIKKHLHSLHHTQKDKAKSYVDQGAPKPLPVSSQHVIGDQNM